MLLPLPPLLLLLSALFLWGNYSEFLCAAQMISQGNKMNNKKKIRRSKVMHFNFSYNCWKLIYHFVKFQLRLTVAKRKTKDLAKFLSVHGDY